MKERLDIYLAIAVTTKCNYRCFYCKEGGESICKSQETIPFEKMKKIVRNSYEIGISNFRITGGEPTQVEYFGELIGFIMSFPNTKIRINTNGFLLLKYIDIIEKYKMRIDIVFSVDSISKFVNGVYFPKYLSPEVVNLTNELVKREIKVRYNIVVTSLNKNEVKRLILRSIDELNVNVKLLDLNKFSEYLGYDGKVSGEAAFYLWKKLFVPMSEFYDFLEKISNNHESEWTTGLIGKGHGIPMSSYFRNGNWIQVKDSQRKPKYSEYCKNECIMYKKGECQEGVFSLFLSANLILHLSGCKNKSLQFDLNDCDDTKVKETLEKLLYFVFN